MKFPCTRCGLCCQRISGVDDLKAFDRGNGVCRHYDTDEGCLIYDSRPLACRIIEGFERYASNQLSIEQYLRSNADVCNRLQDEAGMDTEFRVNL